MYGSFDVVQGIVPWVYMHTTQLIGSIILIALPTLYIYWRRSIKAAIEKKLDVKVLRISERRTRDDMGTLIKALEIDYDFVNATYKDIPMISLGDYMSTLQATGNFSLQRALISVIDAYGFQMALPLALFAPMSWKKESVLGDSSTMLGQYASMLVTNLVSTLGLMTISTLSQKYAETIRTERQRQLKAIAAGNTTRDEAGPPAKLSTKKKYSPLQLMCLGSNPNKDKGLSSRLSSSTGSRESPFILTADGLQRASGIPYGDGPLLDAPEPSLISPYFPDLASGNGGLKTKVTLAQSGVNNVVAAVFNKLCANALVGVHPSAVLPKDKFFVRIGNDTVTTTDALVDALERSGHSVDMYILTNVTSFGVGLCVKESRLSPDATVEGSDTSNTLGNSNSEYGWVQIPVAYPFLTGLYSNAQGQDTEVMMLMPHASIRCEIRGPLVSCGLEWCLSVEGFTGWLPLNGIDRRWQLDENSSTRHSEEYLSTTEQRCHALRLISASTAALNCASTDGQLLLGGYGYLGVCIDSVAVIQQALANECTMYPLLLGGTAKMMLLNAYESIQKKASKAGSAWEFHKEAELLRTAMIRLPCDGIVEPSAALGTARRALACLPKKSVFKAVKKCKVELEEALATAERFIASTKN